jgi:asparagine synthase (glutamine-hydrolysing)
MVLLATGQPVRRDGGREAIDPRALALDVSRRGEAALKTMAGAFAVAASDGAHKTWAAVDCFGIETACWRIVDGRMHVASRADELANVEPKAAIRPGALFEYLYFHVIPSPGTVFEGVHRVPPGHIVCFDGTSVESTRYWAPEFGAAGRTDQEGMAAEFRDLLRQSVAHQLDESKPACYLSGGTDSSTVAGMIAGITGGRVASYSIGFDAEGYDEMAFARIASRHFGNEHHEYYVTPDDLLAGIPLVAAAFDQPFGNSSAVPAYFCARMAKQDGVSRLLAGDGGDELFGGNSRYAKQKLFDMYQWLPAPLRRAALEPLLRQPALARLPLLRKAASYAAQAKVPMPDRLEIYNLLLRLDPCKVLEPRLLDRVDAGAPLRQQREVWFSVGHASELNRHLAFDWRYTLAEADLPKVSVSARLAGVEPRFPMLDHAVVDFSLRLRDIDKLRGQKLRWFFKEALKGFLPPEIIQKKKQGFGLPFGVWLLRHQALMSLARDSVESLVERGVVQRTAADQLFATQIHQHPAYFGEMVWILMMLEQWVRNYRPAWRLEA